MHITLATTAPAATLLRPLIQNDTLHDTLTALADELGLQTATLPQDFSADAGETLPLYGADGGRTWLLGLGKKPQPFDWYKNLRTFGAKQKTKLPAHVALDLRGQSADVAEAAILGLRAGGYDLKLYQTDKPAAPAFYGDEGQLTLVVDEPSALDRAALGNVVNRANVVADAQRAMMDLANAPGNRKTPATLASWAVASGQQHGYNVTVHGPDELREQGFHALLSVNKGSAEPPALIVCEYVPDVVNPKTVALVGKGITFDTGGISIKPSANMHLMKSDMGGAAAVLGAVEVAARLRLPVRVVGIIPTTENMVDGAATRPGDVISSYAGKTIEIIDTDAEGRVILADGLAYAVRQFQPDVLIDLATLTGSVITTFGYHAAGLFTNNATLAADLTAVADQTGERVWQLPLWDIYKDDLKSDVADVKNFSGKPLNGAIAAAKFLEVFTDEHPAWAHLDIAGVAFGDTEFGQQKNATAWGVRLLTAFLERSAGL